MMKPYVILASILFGCGPAPFDEALSIHAETSVAWAHASDFEPRAWRVVEEALQFWGADRITLLGWTLTVTDDVPCMAGNLPAGGCAIGGSTRTVYVGTTFGECVEATPIPHEIGHAVLYETTGDIDPYHRDPRWPTVRPAGSRFCPEAP